MNSRPICGAVPQPVCPNSKWNVDESKDTQTANGGQEVGLAGISFFGTTKVWPSLFQPASLLRDKNFSSQDFRVFLIKKEMACGSCSEKKEQEGVILRRKIFCFQSG